MPRSDRPNARAEVAAHHCNLLQHVSGLVDFALILFDPRQPLRQPRALDLNVDLALRHALYAGRRVSAYRKPQMPLASSLHLYIAVA